MCEALLRILIQFLLEGILQNRDNVIHVRAIRLMELSDYALEVQSHDFHQLYIQPRSLREARV